MDGIYRLGSRWELPRGVPLLPYRIVVGYLAKLRGPDEPE
jgi:hypothetical protein